jgi:FtsP/CotA-like multicopper oxidase with cupredoxin domain
MLGNVEGGMAMHKMWSDPISENPSVGDTEVWEFFNFTADAHPMHVHEVTFEVVNRQSLVTDHEGIATTPAELVGEPRGPEPWETGYKDTVIAYPGEVTRIRSKFDTPGTFVWHCHIVEHEDNEMMRPYRIGPVQPGQPE